MNEEYSAILQALTANREAYLERTADGVSYTRAFALPERLILLGAGHVSRATASFAVNLGFAVTVVDDRSVFANEARFPEASEILCEEFVKAIRDKLHIGARDYVCILTRGHRWDADCLRAILPGEMPFYLGMIGSKRRVSQLLRVLKEEGFDKERLAAVHSPIGLAIKARTPEEIAISILAELILERRSREVERTSLEETAADLPLIRFLADSESPRAMILVLETKGPTPAKAGSMMAVAQNGRCIGTVGGGCSEADAISAAMRVIGTGRTEIITVDLTGDIAEEEGMVCGGTMKILVEDVT